MALPPYDPHQGCPACGRVWAGVRPSFDPETGAVNVSCERCGFQYATAPHYTGVAFLLRQHQEGGRCAACSWPRTDVAYVTHQMGAKRVLAGKSRPLGLAFIENMIAFMERAIGASLGEVMPLLIVSCQRCRFMWPELPLNHPRIASIVALRAPEPVEEA